MQIPLGVSGLAKSRFWYAFIVKLNLIFENKLLGEPPCVNIVRYAGVEFLFDIFCLANLPLRTNMHFSLEKNRENLFARTSQDGLSFT